MRALGITALAAAFLGCGAAARAESELRELYRSPRAQAMGNAYTAMADDEDALFYNPAGLAGVQRYTMNYASIGLELSGDVGEMLLSGGGNAFSQLGGDSINALIGKNIYARAQIAPTFAMPGFGIGILVDGQAAIYAKNKALPHLTIGYQNTNGVQAGYAFSLGRRGRARSNSDIRFGVGAKILWRRGGYRLFPIERLTAIGADTLSEVAGNWGTGYGADIGAQYLHTVNRALSLKWGLAWTDIGDTSFTGGADAVRNNLSAGLGGTFTTGKAVISLAYDYRHILNEADWRKRNHIGAEVALPLLSIQGGLNQSYITYGLGFDAWLLKVSALSYKEELDAYQGQNGSRRYMLKVALKAGF